MWLEELLNEIGISFTTSIIYCDNQGAIKIAENQGSSGRTKHVSIRLELIKTKVKDGEIIIRHIKGTENIADIFTKPLGRICFMKLRNLIMNGQLQHQGGMLNEKDKITLKKNTADLGDLVTEEKLK